MASITIRRLDEGVKTRLRLRAAQHGRSMEEEAREILRTGVGAEPATSWNLAESIRRHIDPVGGVELKIPARERMLRRPHLAS